MVTYSTGASKVTATYANDILIIPATNSNLHAQEQDPEKCPKTGAETEREKDIQLKCLPTQITI